MLAGCPDTQYLKYAYTGIYLVYYTPEYMYTYHSIISLVPVQVSFMCVYIYYTSYIINVYCIYIKYHLCIYSGVYSQS